MLEITPIHPKGMSTPFGVWTTAMSVGGADKLVFISGLTARDETGEVVGIGDMAAQTRQVCANLECAVSEAGGALSNIVSVTVYATDVTKFDEIHRERRAYFEGLPPSSAMVEVVRLVDERCLIEISAIAAL